MCATSECGRRAVAGDWPAVMPIKIDKRPGSRQTQLIHARSGYNDGQTMDEPAEQEETKAGEQPDEQTDYRQANRQTQMQKQIDRQASKQSGTDRLTVDRQTGSKASYLDSD